MSEPRQLVTIAEQLDASQSGEEFGRVLNNLFGVLEKAREEEASDV